MVNRSNPVRRLFYFAMHTVFLRSWYVRRELKSMRKRFSDPQILDAGTGFGQYTHFLSRVFPAARITSVDLKHNYLASLNKMYHSSSHPPVFREQDLLELDYDREFDLVLNVDVMEHIEDDRRVFRGFGRALKPGGTLLLHTPALPEEAVEENHAFVGEHVREGYKHSDITAKLSEAGFVDIRITPTYRFWGGLAWKLLLKYPMLMLSVTRLMAIILIPWYLVTLPIAIVLMWLEMVTGAGKGGCLLLQARKA